MVIKKIRPMFNAIVTTMDLYSEEELKTGGIIDSSKINMPVKEFQKVVAIGPSVRNIEIGDIVKINPTRYKVKSYEENSVRKDLQSLHPVESYQFKIVQIDDIKYLFLADTDVEFVVEEYEEDPPQSDIIVASNDIVQV